MAHRDEKLRVFYDGDCLRCRAFAARHAGMSTVILTDLESGGDVLRKAGITRADALRRIHALSDDGRIMKGIDAVAAVWRLRPGLRWFAFLIGLPGVHALASRLYDRVAARRRREARP